MFFRILIVLIFAFQSVIAQKSYPRNIANDPLFKKQWALNSKNSYSSLELLKSWTYAKNKGKGVLVAVIDTGVDIQHPDLKENIWINKNEIPNNGIDDDNNGYIDDYNGVNLWSGKHNKIFDGHGHGTHISGIIAAKHNNHKGITGVAPNVQILPISYFKPSSRNAKSFKRKQEKNYPLYIAEGIRYAIKMKADIINLSLGGYEPNASEKAAIKEAAAAGILIIAAAGNEATNLDSTKFYPANYKLPNIISVAAIDKKGELGTYSNYGKTNVDVLAPGSQILSTLPQNKYGIENGTSQATAFVTGVAALIKGQNPDYNYSQIKSQLMKNLKVVPLLKNFSQSAGKLNAYLALKPVQINYNYAQLKKLPIEQFTNKNGSLNKDVKCVLCGYRYLCGAVDTSFIEVLTDRSSSNTTIAKSCANRNMRIIDKAKAGIVDPASGIFWDLYNEVFAITKNKSHQKQMMHKGFSYKSLLRSSGSATLQKHKQINALLPVLSYKEYLKFKSIRHTSSNSKKDYNGYIERLMNGHGAYLSHYNYGMYIFKNTANKKVYNLLSQLLPLRLFNGADYYAKTFNTPLIDDQDLAQMKEKKVNKLGLIAQDMTLTADEIIKDYEKTLPKDKILESMPKELADNLALAAYEQAFSSDPIRVKGHENHSSYNVSLDQQARMHSSIQQAAQVMNNNQDKLDKEIKNKKDQVESTIAQINILQKAKNQVQANSNPNSSSANLPNNNSAIHNNFANSGFAKSVDSSLNKPTKQNQQNNNPNNNISLKINGETILDSKSPIGKSISLSEQKLDQLLKEKTKLVEDQIKKLKEDELKKADSKVEGLEEDKTSKKNSKTKSPSNLFGAGIKNNEKTNNQSEQKKETPGKDKAKSTPKPPKTNKPQNTDSKPNPSIPSTNKYCQNNIKTYLDGIYKHCLTKKECVENHNGSWQASKEKNNSYDCFTEVYCNSGVGIWNHQTKHCKLTDDFKLNNSFQAISSNIANETKNTSECKEKNWENNAKLFIESYTSNYNELFCEGRIPANIVMTHGKNYGIFLQNKNSPVLKSLINNEKLIKQFQNCSDINAPTPYHCNDSKREGCYSIINKSISATCKEILNLDETSFSNVSNIRELKELSIQNNSHFYDLCNESVKVFNKLEAQADNSGNKQAELMAALPRKISFWNDYRSYLKKIMKKENFNCVKYSSRFYDDSLNNKDIRLNHYTQGNWERKREKYKKFLQDEDRCSVNLKKIISNQYEELIKLQKTNPHFGQIINFMRKSGIPIKDNKNKKPIYESLHKLSRQMQIYNVVKKHCSKSEKSTEANPINMFMKK